MNIETAINNSPRTARSRTFDVALRELHKRFGDTPVTMVETGTIRQRYDSGDGWSTAVWKAYAEQCGGHVWTCDISDKHMEVCREVTANSEHVTYVVDDSEKFLRNFDKEIHFLYLDSYDTGGDEENTFNACFHQLKEAGMSIRKLHPSAIVMMDDVPPDFMKGKGELSIPFFLGNGFKIVNYQEPQIILSRV